MKLFDAACVSDGSSARGSASGEEEWSEDMEEPEMEFDEMGLELAAQDGKMIKFLLIFFSDGQLFKPFLSVPKSTKTLPDTISSKLVSVAKGNTSLLQPELNRSHVQQSLHCHTVQDEVNFCT